MICANCGNDTTKKTTIEAGIEYSMDVCERCSFIQGKKSLNPIINQTQDVFVAQTKKPGFFARILNRKSADKYDPYTPESWKKQQHIIPKHETPPGSGMGYIYSPYASLWGKMWGITPIADLAKYRLMYRTVPKVKRGIDKTVSSAIIKGFNGFEITEQFEIPPDYKFLNEEEFKELVIDHVKHWVESQKDFNLNVSMIASDMLVYGNAYVELVYEDLEAEDLFDDGLKNFEIPNPNYGAGQGLIGNQNVSPSIVVDNPKGKYTLVSPKGRLVWMKPLDPLYMRVRADAYGNVYGYLQFMSAPPVAYTPEKMAHFRYSPKSWQYECFTPETLVRSEYGIKEIKDVVIGDSVLMGNGEYGIVTDTNAREYTNDLIEIGTSKYTESTCVTPNHPFLIRQFGDFDRPRISQYGFTRFSEDKWVNAEDIRKNDLLRIPVPRDVVYNDISEDLLYFIGFFTAEGFSRVRRKNSCETAIVFAEGIDDGSLYKIKQTLDNLNVKYYTYYTEPRMNVGMFRIETRDKYIYDLIKNCGKLAQNKKFPDWVMKLPPEKQMVVLNAYLDGDGHRRPERTMAVTVSRTLAHQLQTIYLRNNIICSIYKKPARGKTKILDQVVNSKHDVYVVDTFTGKHPRNGWFIDGNLYVKVTDVTTKPYTGLVYNLTVSENETYCVNAGYTVHNCLNGTSILMSLIRTQDIIWQLENDLILLGHATVKPPVIFACGDEEKPWSKKMFTDFIASSSTRGPGGDVYTHGDVKTTPLPAPTESIQHMVNYLKYQDVQRTIALGVPPQLLGQPEGSSRTTAEVSFNDWINILEIIQKEISDTLEDQVFRRVVELEFGEGAPVPRPIWNTLFEKSEDSIVSKIISLKQSGIITVNESRMWLNSLNIDVGKIDGGDIIPEMEMGLLQIEDMERNLENDTIQET